MLIKRTDLENIFSGQVTVAFRKWKRPTVKSGGTLRTQLGVLRIRSVRSVRKSDISRSDAEQAGFDSLKSVLAELDSREGEIFKIELEPGGTDPRVELRNRRRISSDEVKSLTEKLSKFDATSTSGAWTQRVLRAIESDPGKPAADLAKQLGLERLWMKRQIRKLKELGLTESLSPGYRISPRGNAFLKSKQSKKKST